MNFSFEILKEVTGFIHLTHIQMDGSRANLWDSRR